MKLEIKHQLILFITAFTQVYLVSAQTFFLSRGMEIPIVIAGFFISYMWVGNVKKIVIGGLLEKLIYSTGASIGAIIGYWFAKFLHSIYG